MTSYNQKSLKPGILRVINLAGIEPSWHCSAGEKAGKQHGRQCGNNNLRNAWGIQGGDYSLFSEHISEVAFTETSLQEEKEVGNAISLPHTLA